jgi:Zn-dependent protease with chaperone function
MDFFAQQDHARRKTQWLVLYFALAVISIIVLVYGVAVFVSFYYGLQTQSHHLAEPVALEYWNARLFGAVALGTLAVIFCGSAWKTAMLAGGGGAMAESLGGRLVASNTVNPDERRLLNVVEEMAIASGVPMPQVYVLDGEKGINAFAAGHSTGDAAVAVTDGCLKLLSRDELQGVIGHEFSHILNGDMKLNLRLIGILFGIFCIATIGRILMSVRGRKNGGPVLVGLLLLAIGSLGVFFGRLIQAAVSRQREFLADAASVQFTRNPAGLSGALQKIGGYGFGSWLVDEQAPDAGHLFFSNGIPRPFFNALSTHPPLETRIRTLDPSWDGKFPHVSTAEILAENTGRKPEPIPVFKDGLLTGVILAGTATARPAIRTHAVLPSLGNPTPLHLQYAEQLRAALPPSVQAAAHEPLDATALIYALLLDDDEKLRVEQLAEIARRISNAVSEKTAALFPEVSAVARRSRLPLVNLALGALRQLTPEQFPPFSETLEWLVDSDGKVELFEFVLQKIVQRNLASKFSGARPPAVQFYTLKPLVPDCAVILSALANVSSADDGEIKKAFAAGAPYLRAPDNVPLELLSREQCGVDALGAALDRLALAVPIIKKNLITACAHVVGADGVILETEAELLRAITDTLDCPLPPMGVSE